VPVEDYLGNSLSTALITAGSDYAYAQKNLKSQLYEKPIAAINYLEWDKSVDPSPLNNQLVREAIAMAIDRQPIASRTENGLVSPTSLPAIPGWPTAKYEHNPYPYNVTKARKLLAQAGYPNGKGMPPLYLYCETTAGNPQYVPMAEAVAAELKQNLNINFTIQTLNPTQWNALSVDGMQKGILPGYNIASGGPNWAGTDPGSFPLSINQWVTEWASGAIGPQSYRQHASQWFFYAYDPQEVKAWGNPNNPQAGVSFSQWQPLITAAKKAIPVIMAFWNKQPRDFFDNNSGFGPGSPSLTTTLNTYIASYKTAKTPAEKHADWVSFWEWVGTHSTGTGTTSLGLVDQAYVMTNEPALQYDIWSWTGVLWSSSGQQALQLGAKIANTLMASGYFVPLNYENDMYLVKPGLQNVDPNPNLGAFGNFYNLQYMSYK
jgi:peptide/nickel transport system substrate-binding protein/oligopeptide transport system substrate-binding protein